MLAFWQTCVEAAEHMYAAGLLELPRLVYGQSQLTGNAEQGKFPVNHTIHCVDMQRHVYWYGGSGVLAIADPLYYLMIYWLRSDAYTQVHKKQVL
jgi:hypothetical protein